MFRCHAYGNIRMNNEIDHLVYKNYSYNSSPDTPKHKWHIAADGLYNKLTRLAI